MCALSLPRNVFGVHSFTPQNLTTGEFYGIALVLGAINFEFTAEQESLFGGSQKTPWAIEVKTISSTFTVTFKQYEKWMYEIFAGGTVTENTGETTGDVGTIANFKGTSVVNATTGIASIAATAADEADLKFGKLVLKATGAATVQPYYSTNVDFKRGTDVVFGTDLLPIGSPITVPDAGATVEIADLGLEITGGSGTVAFVTDDTAQVLVRPINAKNIIVDIGAQGDVFPEFGAIMLAAKRGRDELFEVEAYRAQGAGLPTNLAEGAWSTADVSMTALYDATLDKTFTIRALAV